MAKDDDGVIKSNDVLNEVILTPRSYGHLLTDLVTHDFFPSTSVVDIQRSPSVVNDDMDRWDAASVMM